MNPAFECVRPGWPMPGVRAAMTLRGGGHSRGAYASLNLGAHVGDAPDAVAANRALLSAALQLPAEPLWLRQAHGVQVLDADAAPSTAIEPAQADAAITRRGGRVLAVLVADCMPVLLTRADGTAVAAAHAGWRGLAAGILEATVAALRAAVPGQDEAPAATLQAWLGPAIGPRHFEVGEDVRAAFCDRDATATDAFSPNVRGRWLCDLEWLARRRLAALGVSAVRAAHRCTFAEPNAFYSFRRDGVTGRMAALIWMEPTSASA